MDLLREIKILQQPLDTPSHIRYQFKSLRGSSHSWALSHLQKEVTGKSILDVGAGGGGIGLTISSLQPKSMTAVEIDTRAHKALHKTYNLVVTDLDSLQEQDFDWIVALDILEHLPNPEEYLKNLKRLLAPGGKILLSVPNVAHWSVRFPLFFFGSFEYRSPRIMDASHIYFFSRKRFKTLCASLSGAKVTELSASIEPFELALPTWIGESRLYRGFIPIRQWCAKTFPGLMAYQHLALIEAFD